jgi:hypothetical protein
VKCLRSAERLRSFLWHLRWDRGLWAVLDWPTAGIVRQNLWLSASNFC